MTTLPTFCICGEVGYHKTNMVTCVGSTIKMNKNSADLPIFHHSNQQASVKPVWNKLQTLLTVATEIFQMTLKFNSFTVD